jgi:hypothetical protein
MALNDVKMVCRESIAAYLKGIRLVDSPIFKVATSEDKSKALWRYKCCSSNVMLHSDGVGCNSKQLLPTTGYYRDIPNWPVTDRDSNRKGVGCDSRVD